MYKTILVPLDGSELAASILDQVGTLAQGYGARLLLMTVGASLPTSLPRAQDIQLSLTFQSEAYFLKSDGRMTEESCGSLILLKFAFPFSFRSINLILHQISLKPLLESKQIPWMPRFCISSIQTD